MTFPKLDKQESCTSTGFQTELIFILQKNQVGWNLPNQRFIYSLQKFQASTEEQIKAWHEFY